MGTGEQASQGRRPALDGLRGVAAVVVVVHHTLMVSPALLDAYAGAPRGVVAWLLVDTPLRLLWAGDVAVAVFFVLSGYVLAVSGRGASWSAYFRRRLVRLYLPVWGAVALALAFLVVFPRSGDSGRSAWVDSQAVSVTSGSLLRTLTLFMPDQLVVPLWSLRWEVVFSLLLPVYLGAARWLRRFPLPMALGVVLVAVLAGAVTGVEALRFLPVFEIGVLLADREQALLARVGGWGRRRWVLLGAAAVALMSTHVYWLIAPGAGLVVFLALACRPVAAALSRRAPLWLGRVSFSLYLVHIVVVLAAASVVPLPAPLLLVVTVPGALVLAAVFSRWVETPAQRLAHRASSAGSAPSSPSRLGWSSPSRPRVVEPAETT